MLDEPSLGLAPLIVRQIFAVLAELNKRDGLTVFLVEQNAFHALKLAHRGYVMVNGAITMTGTGAELPLAWPEIRDAYLGRRARLTIRGQSVTPQQRQDGSPQPWKNREAVVNSKIRRDKKG